MRIWLFWAGTLMAVGCATSGSPEAISAQQRERFRATIAAAHELAPSWDCPQSDAQLQAAESDFYFADHLPKDPERAQQIAQKAQQQAEAALELRRREAMNLRGVPPRNRVADVR